MKKRGVQPEQPAMIIHARRKHRQNSNFRESRGDHREYETKWDITDDEEQFTKETNSVTVNGDEWWLKFHGQDDELPWPREDVDDGSLTQTYKNTPECFHCW